MPSPFMRRHPEEAGADKVRQYLTWLAVDRKVGTNTRKVALNSLVYLYRKYMNRDLGELGFTLAQKQRHLPTVFSVEEVSCILRQLQGRNRLIIQLLYGSGLRINECLRLRVQDVDPERLALTVRDDGALCRHHLHDSVVRKFFAIAVRQAGLARSAGCESGWLGVAGTGAAC